MQNFTCETSFHHFAQLCLRFVGKFAQTTPLFVLLSAYSTLFMPVSPVLPGTVRRRFSIRTSPLGSR